MFFSHTSLGTIVNYKYYFSWFYRKWPRIPSRFHSWHGRFLHNICQIFSKMIILQKPSPVGICRPFLVFYIVILSHFLCPIPCWNTLLQDESDNLNLWLFFSHLFTGISNSKAWLRSIEKTYAEMVRFKKYFSAWYCFYSLCPANWLNIVSIIIYSIVLYLIY